MSDRLEYKWGKLRYPGKTTYLLGAGFSAPMGMPTLANFIPAGMELLLKDAADHPFSTSGVIALRMAFLLNEFRGAMSRLGKPMENLEDLFCLVDLSVPGGHQKAQKMRQWLTTFIHRVILLCCKKHYDTINREKDTNPQTLPNIEATQFQSFRHGTKTVKPSLMPQELGGNVCAYEAFLSRILKNNRQRPLRFQDVILTLNYDLVIEEALQRLARNSNSGADDYFTQFMGKWENALIENKRQRPHVPIFKLHGSVNWTFYSNLTKARRWPINRKSLHNLPKQKYGLAIIPPTWNKSACGEGVFANIYREAMSHVQHSSRIVIIGYSFPSSDAYFRYLLATAMNTPELPKIEIVDKESPVTAIPRLKELLKPVARGDLMYYEDAFPNYMLKESNE